MSAAERAVMARGVIDLATLVEIESSKGVGRFWLNGLGVLDANGEKFYGTGIIAEVSATGTSSDFAAQQITFTLSGVDRDLLDELDESVKGRKARIYEALLDQHYRVIEMELVEECDCDVRNVEFQEEGKVDIKMTTNTGLVSLRNRSAAKISPEEKKQRFPDETGYDEVYFQEDLADQWRSA